MILCFSLGCYFFQIIWWTLNTEPLVFKKWSYLAKRSKKNWLFFFQIHSVSFTEHVHWAIHKVGILSGDWSLRLNWTGSEGSTSWHLVFFLSFRCRYPTEHLTNTFASHTDTSRILGPAILQASSFLCFPLSRQMPPPILRSFISLAPVIPHIQIFSILSSNLNMHNVPPRGWLS